MTKQKFLDQLKEALNEEFVIPQQVIDDTLKEYGSMIDDALESGQTIEAFSQSMGSPKKVAKALAKEYPYHRSNVGNRIVALTPFIATIAFFLLGFFLNAWHPGWLVFFLIPVAGILTSSRINWKGLLVFFILSIFILGGTIYSLWTPLWSLFLLLIVLPNTQDKMKKLRIYAIGYSLLVIALYHMWILFPFIEVSTEQETLLNRVIPVVLFLPIVIFGFFNGAIQIHLDITLDRERRFKIFLNFMVVLGIIALYFILGLFLEGFWHPGWLVFLLIPLYFIFLNAKRFPWVAIMPFVATALFVLVGEYVTIQNSISGYALSWLFFLLIPMTGILSKGGDSQ
jgi:hypothetical protein